jgi:hypothetical protein
LRSLSNTQIEAIAHLARLESVKNQKRNIHHGIGHLNNAIMKHAKPPKVKIKPNAKEPVVSSSVWGDISE